MDGEAAYKIRRIASKMLLNPRVGGSLPFRFKSLESGRSGWAFG